MLAINNKRLLKISFVNCQNYTKILCKTERKPRSVLFYLTVFGSNENYRTKLYEKFVKITKKYLKC